MNGRQQVLKIDDCSAEQLYDLLASLDVNVEKFLEKSPSIDVLRGKYRRMLSRQLKDFRSGDACMDPVWQGMK